MQENIYNIMADLSKKTGPVKRMHAVNNGPLRISDDPRLSNFEAFKTAKIPFVRNHDASFCPYYGGEHTVDVHFIFPNFDADVNDPASYDFFHTDKYLSEILSVGSQIVYRLGTKIENSKKRYAAYPPKDIAKWAEICEHIVAHYNDGWAEGFHWNIEYWEIWNEPEGAANWMGTPEEYYELYKITATRLKDRFPKIKIGTAFAYPKPTEFKAGFFEMLKRENGRVPLDFHGIHSYSYTPTWISDCANMNYDQLKEYGYEDAEIIISEYNHCIKDGGMHEKFSDTVKAITGIQGATYVASAMCEGQNSHLDMLMYYDARPCLFNGMFDFYTLAPLKGYYPFLMFSELYELGTQVETTIEGNAERKLSTVFASGEGGEAAMISYFPYDDKTPARVNIRLKGTKTAKYSVYILDDTHNMEKIDDLIFENGEASIAMQPMSVILLKSE